MKNPTFCLKNLLNKSKNLPFLLFAPCHSSLPCNHFLHSNMHPFMSSSLSFLMLLQNLENHEMNRNEKT